jgi:hypothetical protein
MNSHSLFGQFKVNGRIFIETDPGNPSFTDDGWQTDPGVPNLYITLEKYDGSAWKWENGNEYTSFGNAWEDGIYQFTIQDPGEYRVRAQVFQNFVAVNPWPEWIVQSLGDPNNTNIKDHTMRIVIDANSPAMQTINMVYEEETDQPEAVDDIFDPGTVLIVGNPSFTIDVLKNDTPTVGLTIVGVSRNFEPSSNTFLQGDEFTSQIEVVNNKVLWTPNGETFPGNRFTYTVEDSQGNRDFARMFLEFVSYELTANDDAIFVGTNSIANLIPALNNDIDSDPHLTFTINEIPSTSVEGGTLTADTELKNVYYTPPPNFEGTDGFEYSIRSMGGETAGPATVTIVVGIPQNPNPPVAVGVLALIRNLLDLFDNSPQAIHLLELLRQHKTEILYYLNNQSGDQTAPKLFNRSSVDLPEFSTNAAGTADTEAAFANLISALEPDIKALLTGNGDNIVITQELVDAVKVLQASVEAAASDALKADIQDVSAMFNNLDDFVGKNFNEAIELLGVDSNASGIVAFDPKLDGGKFSITTYAAADLNFKLWKSSTLQFDSWEEVTNAEVVEEGLYKTLSDPNPVGDRFFYRLTNN